jgi:hypothetical protein
MGDLFKRWFGPKPTPQIEVPTEIKPVPSPITPSPTVPLSWELPCSDDQVSQGAHPERKEWSDYLFEKIWINLDLFNKAKDIFLVVPNWNVLSDRQRATKLAEMFVQIAKFESSWRPAVTSANLDGSISRNKLGTGFFQLCVFDQDAYHTETHFTHEDLKDSFNNIQAGVGIVVYLLKVHNQITFTKGQDHGFFFETLLFGAKYNSVDKILAAVAKLRV